MLGRRDRHELALAHQLVEQLRVVHDLVVPVELRVLPAQRVEAVRAGGDDLAGAGLAALEHPVEHLDVLLGEHLEQELVARAPRRVAGAGLLRAEHHVVHPGPVQQLGGGLHGLLRAVVERARAADPEQVLHLRRQLAVEDVDVEAELLGPVQAVAGVLPPRVALVLQVAEQRPQLGGELRLDQHLVAAHVDDVVDVLDVDRALLHARPARGARPQHVRVDHPALLGGAHQRPGRLLRPRPAHPLEARLRHAVPVVALRRWRPRSRSRPPRASPCRRSGTGPWPSGDPADP